MGFNIFETLDSVVNSFKSAPLEEGQMLVNPVPREELASTPLAFRKDAPSQSASLSDPSRIQEIPEKEEKFSDNLDTSLYGEEEAVVGSVLHTSRTQFTERSDQEKNENPGFNVGDIWIKKNTDGTPSRILITAFPVARMVDIRRGEKRDELLAEPREDDSNNVEAHSISIEVLKKTLKEEGYEREKSQEEIHSETKLTKPTEEKTENTIGEQNKGNVVLLVSDQVMNIGENQQPYTEVTGAVLEQQLPQKLASFYANKETINNDKSSLSSETITGASKQEAQKSTKKTIQSKKNTVLEKNISLPHKGDVFEDTTNGDRIVVGTIIHSKGEDPQIYYTKTNSRGVEYEKGKTGQKKFLENFRVLVSGMTKTDPIKEQYPAFYALYEEEITKLNTAFLCEFEATKTAMNSWLVFINDEYGDSFSEKLNDPAKKKEGEKMVKDYEAIKEKIETIGRKWNELDDRIVGQGRQEFLLFADLRALESVLPDYVLELKISELKLLEEANGSKKPNFELVETGYQKALLDRKVLELKNRYEKARQSFDSDITEDAPHPPEFFRQIDEWMQSADDHSSSEEIKEVLEKLDAFEKKIFLDKKKKRHTTTEEDNGSIGGRVKQGKEKRTQKKEKEIDNHRGKKSDTVRKSTDVRLKNSSEVSEGDSLVPAEEQDEKAREQKQTAYKTKQKIDEVIRDKKRLAKRMLEDLENAGKISKKKFQDHIGLLDDLQRDSQKLVSDVNIAGLQAILKKVKGVELKVDDPVTAKKNTEAPVSPGSEKPKQKTYEDLYQSLGRDENEIAFEKQKMEDALRDGFIHIRNQIEVQGMITYKEKIVTAFSQKFLDLFAQPSWTSSEKKLFFSTFVEKYFEKFIQ